VLKTMPSGLYLVGSRAGQRANLMAANWVSQVAVSPKLVGTGVEVGACTHELIKAGGAFSVCLLSRDDRAVVRKFVKPATWDGDAATLNGLAVHEALTGAPILASSVAWLDCELRQEVACGSHTWFVGEVVDCGFSGQEGAEILRVEDTRMSYGG
jgi:flavin reductase (DIM6/NTAB) family NADH-FMN oxidoreductase RutF